MITISDIQKSITRVSEENRNWIPTRLYGSKRIIKTIKNFDYSLINKSKKSQYRAEAYNLVNKDLLRKGYLLIEGKSLILLKLVKCEVQNDFWMVI